MHVPVTIKQIKRLKDPPWTNICHSDPDKLTVSDGIHICTQNLGREGAIKRRLSNLETIRNDVALVFPFDTKSEFACGITKSGHIFVYKMGPSAQLYLIQGLPEFLPTSVSPSKKDNKRFCGCVKEDKVQHNFEILESDFHQSLKVLKVGPDLSSLILIMNYTVFHWKSHLNSTEAKESVQVLLGEWQTKLLDLYPHKIIATEATQCSSQRFGSLSWKLLVVFSTLDYVYAKIYSVLPNFQSRPNLVVERQIKISDILPKVVKTATDAGAQVMAIAQNCHKSQESSVKILVPQSNQIFNTELNGEDISCICFGPGNQVIHCLGSSQRLFLLSRTGLLLMTTLPHNIPKPFIDLRHFKSDHTNSVPMFHAICFTRSSSLCSNGTDLVELTLPPALDDHLQFVQLLISRAQFMVHPEAFGMVQRLRGEDLPDWKAHFCSHGWRQDLDKVKISLNLLSHAILDALIALGSLEHSRKPLLKVQRRIVKIYGLTLMAEIKSSSSKVPLGRKWLKAAVSFGKLDQGQNSLSILSKLTGHCFSTVSKYWPKDGDLRELLRFLKSLVLDFRHTFENVPGTWIKRHIYESNLTILYNQAQIRNDIPMLIKIQRHFQTQGQALMRVPVMTLRGKGCLSFFKGQSSKAIWFWHQSLVRNQGQKLEQVLDIFYCLIHSGAVPELVLYMNWVHEAQYEAFRTVVEHYINLIKMMHNKCEHYSEEYLRSLAIENIQSFQNQALNGRLSSLFDLQTALSLMSLSHHGIKDFQDLLESFNLWRESLALDIIQNANSSHREEPGQMEKRILSKVIDLKSIPNDTLLPDLLGLLRLFPNASIAIHSQICVLFRQDEETVDTNHVLDNKYVEIKWVEWLLLLLKELNFSHFEIMIQSLEFARHCQRHLNWENEIHLREISLPNCVEPNVWCGEDRNDNIYKALDIYDHIDYVSTSSIHAETISFLIAELPTTDLKAKYFVRFHSILAQSESVLVGRRVQRMMAEMRKVKVKVGDLDQSVESWIDKGPPLLTNVHGKETLSQFVFKSQLRLRTTEVKHPILLPSPAKPPLPSHLPHPKDFLTTKKGLFRSSRFLTQKDEFYSIGIKPPPTEPQHIQNMWTLPLWSKCQSLTHGTDEPRQLSSQLHNWLQSLPNGTRYEHESPNAFAHGQVLTLRFMEHILSATEQKTHGKSDPKPRDLDNLLDRHEESEDSCNSARSTVCVSSPESGLGNDTDKHFIVADVHREVPIPKPRKLIHSNDKQVFSSDNHSISSDTSLSALSTIFEVSEEDYSVCPKSLPSKRNIPLRNFGTQTTKVIEEQEDPSEEKGNEQSIASSNGNYQEIGGASNVNIDPDRENAMQLFDGNEVLDKEVPLESLSNIKDPSNDNSNQDLLVSTPNQDKDACSNRRKDPQIQEESFLSNSLANDNVTCQVTRLSNDETPIDKQIPIQTIQLLTWDNASCETRPAKAPLSPVPKVELLNKNMLDSLSCQIPSSTATVKEQKVDLRLKLPPFLYLDNKFNDDDDDGNGTDNYFGGIVHFKSAQDLGRKLPKFKYNAGEFDHLLESPSKLEKKAFEDFADIQYGIRCALDGESMVKAKVENPAPIIVHAGMDPMKAENAEANFSSSIDRDEKSEEENTPISKQAEKVSIGIGTQGVERLDQEVQVEFSKAEVNRSRTYSVSLHTSSARNYFSGQLGFQLENEASTSTLVEDYSDEFDEDFSRPDDVEEAAEEDFEPMEEEYMPGTNDEGSCGTDGEDEEDEEEYSNTSKDVPTIESDRVSPHDSPKLVLAAPETPAPSSSLSSQDNSFKLALRDVTNDSSASFLKRTNLLEQLNSGLNHELGRSSQLLRTLTEVSNINEGTECKQHALPREPAARLPERQDSYSALQRQVLNNLKAQPKLQNDQSRTRETKFEQFQKELRVCLEQDGLANLELPFTHHITRQFRPLSKAGRAGGSNHVPLIDDISKQNTSSQTSSSDNEDPLIPHNHPVTTHYEMLRVVPRLEDIQEVISEEYSRSSALRG